MKSIVIEGPNGAGKSCLAKQLAEKYMLPIIHATKPPNSMAAGTLAMKQLGLIAIAEPAIYDRHHAISRIIYQRDIISEYEAHMLGLMAGLTTNFATIIYCIGEGERDMDKEHYTEELKEATRDQEPIRKVYNRVMSFIPHQKYDFKKDDIGSLQLT